MDGCSPSQCRDAAVVTHRVVAFPGALGEFNSGSSGIDPRAAKLTAITRFEKPTAAASA
jgi:hypothetical protein